MAVLEHHPLSDLLGFVNQFNSLGTLALTQRNSLQLIRHVESSCEVEEGLKGISSCRKHVDQRSNGVGTLVNVSHASVDRGHEEVSHLVLNVELESIKQLLRSEHAEHE